MKYLSFLAFLALVAPATAQTEDPLAPIKAAVKDASKPFTLIVEFKLKPGSLKAVRPSVMAAVKATRQEPGNAAYESHLEASSDTVVFFEKWRSIAALEEHVGKDYTKALLDKLKEVAAEPMKARVLTPFFPGGPGGKPAKKAEAGKPAETPKPADASKPAAPAQ